MVFEKSLFQPRPQSGFSNQSLPYVFVWVLESGAYILASEPQFYTRVHYCASTPRALSIWACWQTSHIQNERPALWSTSLWGMSLRSKAPQRSVVMRCPHATQQLRVAGRRRSLASRKTSACSPFFLYIVCLGVFFNALSSGISFDERFGVSHCYMVHTLADQK